MGVGDDTLPRVEVERAEDLKGVTMYVIRTRVGGASTTVRKRHAAPCCTRVYTPVGGHHCIRTLPMRVVGTVRPAGRYNEFFKLHQALLLAVLRRPVPRPPALPAAQRAFEHSARSAPFLPPLVVPIAMQAPFEHLAPFPAKVSFGQRSTKERNSKTVPPRCARQPCTP